MKAVIATGGKQYLVSKDDVLDVELLADTKQKLEFTPLLVIDGQTTKVGTPKVDGAKVSAKIVTPRLKGEKVAIRKFQAKKRVNTLKGHRQNYTRIQITAISGAKSTAKAKTTAKSGSKKPKSRAKQGAPKAKTAKSK